MVSLGTQGLLAECLLRVRTLAASAFTPAPPDDPFAIPLAGFSRDMNINATSAFVAAQQAILGFAELPTDAARTFFYTGNILNVVAIPSLMDAGTGKSASAHMMMVASAAYRDRGYKYAVATVLKCVGSKIKTDSL